MKRIFFAALVLILASASCVLRGTRHETLNGNLSGHALAAPAAIVYDEHGVPHITAENEPDLFYALGYAQAQDRFFYMDLMRNAGRGQITNVLGRPFRYKSYDLLTMDRSVKALDFEGRAKEGVESLDPESREILESYVRGVNRYLDDAGKDIPEYKAMGKRPERWSMEDSFVVMDLYGLSMTAYSLFYEYYGARLVAQVGPEKARIFNHAYPKDAPYINQDKIEAVSRLERLGDGLGVLASMAPMFDSIGSNNWVVDGQMSASGKPILANDPHVPTPLVPTFWYHAHLKAGGLDAAGMIFSGIPLMGAGTNGKVAWGITNARCDYIDLFVEKLNPANPNQYEYKGEYRDFEIVTDKIPVLNGPDVKIKYRRSVHGPIIEEAMTGVKNPQTPGQVYSLHLIDVDFGRFFKGYLAIPKSSDADSMHEAVRDMGMGPVAWNTVFATVSGDIGYLYSGHAPKRPDNDGMLPRPGTGEADYEGLIPFDELPHVKNPSKHFIVTANNKVEGPDYPYYLSAGYNIPSRAQRITELLAGRTGLTPDDMGDVQMDVKVKSAERFAPIFVADLEGSGDPDHALCAELLEEWKNQDYMAETSSRGTGVYKLMMSGVAKRTFADDLGKKLYSSMSMADMTMNALWEILEDPDSDWFDDRTTPALETRKDVVRAAAADAVKKMKKLLGKDPEKWEWGDLHTLYLKTPYGFLPWNKKAAIGKFRHRGTEECVANASSVFVGAMGIGYLGVAGPSSRIIVDMADPRHLRFNATTGNSEDPNSPMFDNVTHDWFYGSYRVVSLDREEYERNAIGTLTLSP